MKEGRKVRRKKERMETVKEGREQELNEKWME